VAGVHLYSSGLSFLAEAFVSSSLLQLVIFLPFLLILAIALWRSGVWERRVVRDELADEVGRTVSADEYRDIVGDRMFRTRRIDRLQPRVSAALVNAQHELACGRVRHPKSASANQSLSAIEPVCGTPNGNWKMATRDLRPKTRRSTARDPVILAPETRGLQPKPWEGRRFSHTWKPRRSGLSPASAVLTHREITPQRPDWLAGVTGFEPGKKH
jgi:hypothetical protein